jgi:hypothetical protein
VIWGKKPEYFKGREGMLARISQLAPLHTTATAVAFPPGAAIIQHGHLAPSDWHGLLAESKFLLGLGDPLLGPSAVDAVAAGCVFINPRYPATREGFYDSQHPFLEHAVGPPYVCTVDVEDAAAVEACVRAALAADLPPLVPQPLTPAAYLARVARIFGLRQPAAPR